MENKENIKRLVDDLASINRNLDIKPGSILTPLQVEALEKTLYQNSGIKVEIESRTDFKALEEYYRKKLMLQNVPLEEGWSVCVTKEIKNKITFETKFKLRDRVKITIGEELSIFCRISSISYVEKITFENEVEKECCYGLIPENKNYGEIFAGTYFTEERIEKA